MKVPTNITSRSQALFPESHGDLGIQKQVEILGADFVDGAVCNLALCREEWGRVSGSPGSVGRCGRGGEGER